MVSPRVHVRGEEIDWMELAKSKAMLATCLVSSNAVWLWLKAGADPGMWQGALEDAKRTAGTWLWPGGNRNRLWQSVSTISIDCSQEPGRCKKTARSLARRGGRSGSSGQCLTHVAPRRLGNDYGNDNDVEEEVVV